MRKNNFFYDTNPNVKNLKGEGHVLYVTVKHGHKAKGNIITHSNNFFGSPTNPLNKNPNRESKDKRPSNYSVPVWEKDKYLTKTTVGYWKMDKKDKIAIKKFNKKYGK